MPELRWTLLLLGALFIVVLAWWERRKPRQSARSEHDPGPPDRPAEHPHGEPELTLPQLRGREAPQELPVVRIGEDESFPDLRIDPQRRQPQRFGAQSSESPPGEADGDDSDLGQPRLERRIEPDIGDAIDEQELGEEPRRAHFPAAHPVEQEPTLEEPTVEEPTVEEPMLAEPAGEEGPSPEEPFNEDSAAESSFEEGPMQADLRVPRAQDAQAPGTTQRTGHMERAEPAEPIQWPEMRRGSAAEPYLSDLEAGAPSARESGGREPHISGFEAAPVQPAAAESAAAQAAPAAAPSSLSVPGSTPQPHGAPAAPPVKVPGQGAAHEPIVEWPPEDARRIIALRLVCASPERFSGRAIRTALVAEGFVLGRFSIFHRPDATGHAVLSAASLSKPGVFDPETIDTQRFSGLNLFAVLPGPKSAREALEDLLACARNLNERLEGGLQDERGGPLTPSRIAALRESVQPAGPATRA